MNSGLFIIHLWERITALSNSNFMPKYCRKNAADSVTALFQNGKRINRKMQLADPIQFMAGDERNQKVDIVRNAWTLLLFHSSFAREQRRRCCTREKVIRDWRFPSKGDGEVRRQRQELNSEAPHDERG
jgi:hypothetical protein